MKASYNERYSFDDPLSKWSACRSTRARATKKLKSDRDGEQSSDAVYVANLDIACSPKGDGIVDSVISCDMQEVEATVSQSAVNKRLQCVHSELGIGSMSVWDINDDDDDDDTRDYIDVTEYPQLLEYEVVSPEETSSYAQAEGDEEDMQNLENSDQVHQDASLYIDAPISSMCSRVILMKFVMKHRITQEALADLLQVLQLHLPSPNVTGLAKRYLFHTQNLTHYFGL